MIGTFRVTCGEYEIGGTIGEPPFIYSDILKHASFHDDLRVKGDAGTLLVVTVQRESEAWPGLVASQQFHPGPSSGFHPGVIVIPESGILFIGAGTRVLAYDMKERRRLWEDTADFGFWSWNRRGDVVLMSAELELAAWDIRGRKLWSTFVEPPWSYKVNGDQLELDVMDTKSSFNLTNGPAPPLNNRRG